jgi:hypothetical protein
VSGMYVCMTNLLEMLNSQFNWVFHRNFFTFWQIDISEHSSKQYRQTSEDVFINVMDIGNKHALKRRKIYF